jgi:hypothetical protein
MNGVSKANFVVLWQRARENKISMIMGPKAQLIWEKKHG